MPSSRTTVVTVALAVLVAVGGALHLATDGADAATMASDTTVDRAGETTAAQAVDTAIFAGGCFWCMEPPFEKLDGVRAVISGYTAGRVDQPTYQQVSAGGTGHTEAVLVEFEPARVSYERLLDVFWHNVDPLTADAQFCDHGSQYRTGIYPRTPAQRAAAEASKRAIRPRIAGQIVTEIVDATRFWPAEGYHQDYYKKNPIRYKFYRFNCGRDARLEALWGEAAGVGVTGAHDAGDGTDATAASAASAATVER
jgi:peptide-methionine (S)-S-oxide reductase